MVETNVNSISGVARVDGAKAGASAAPVAPDGVAFRALLERLERDAQALERDVARVDDPKALAGAVDKAHASLQDVLSLGDQLLEAYREAVARGGEGV